MLVFVFVCFNCILLNCTWILQDDNEWKCRTKCSHEWTHNYVRRQRAMELTKKTKHSNWRNICSSFFFCSCSIFRKFIRVITLERKSMCSVSSCLLTDVDWWVVFKFYWIWVEHISVCAFFFFGSFIFFIHNIKWLSVHGRYFFLLKSLLFS